MHLYKLLHLFVSSNVKNILSLSAESQVLTKYVSDIYHHSIVITSNFRVYH